MIRIIKDNRYFFYPYALLLIATAVFLTIVPKGGFLLWVNALNQPAVDVFFKYATYLGDGILYAVVALILFLCRVKYGALAVFISLQLLVVVSFLKKVVFSHIVRPKLFFEGNEVLHYVDGVHVNSHFSFPSGHTAVAFSVFGLLAILSINKRLGFFFLLIAVIGGFSRIYLCQHFLVDTFAGSIVGVLLTMITYYWVSKTKLYQQSPLLNRSLIGLKP